MEKGIVFFDLDGTLLNDDSLVDGHVNKALEKLRKNGYIPMIATGRTVAEVPHILEDTKINSIICMNGQVGIYEGEVLYSNSIDKEIIGKLKDMAEKNGHQLSYYAKDEIKLTGDSDNAVGKFKLVSTPYPDIEPDYYKTNEVNMVLVHSSGQDEEYAKAFPELSFVRNDPFSIDVFTKGTSKAIGIDKFIKELGFENLPIYAFGDGMNDYEMLKMADYSIAMDNGVDELKEIADYVTSSNMEGGIEKALKKYKLI